MFEFFFFGICVKIYLHTKNNPPIKLKLFILKILTFFKHVFIQDFFGKSDPYLEIFRETGAGSNVLIHKTNVVKNTLNPTWQKFRLSMQALSGGNLDTKLTVS